MGKNSGISWTDHTFNPWWGCTKVSPGCDNCYAETFSRRPIHVTADNKQPNALDIWGPGKPRRFFDDKHWDEPLKWNRQAGKEGKKYRVFTDSMCDIFDTDRASIVQMDEARVRLWHLMRATENLLWLPLTKRPVMYPRMMPADLLNNPRIWKGFSAEDQQRYDERAKYMRQLPGVTFVSYEPALGPLDLILRDGQGLVIDRDCIESWEGWYPSWVICGGESGPGHRPMQEAWARALRAQCDILGVPFFMKQVSAATPTKGAALIPADLLVREFPR